MVVLGQEPTDAAIIKSFEKNRTNFEALVQQCMKSDWSSLGLDWVSPSQQVEKDDLKGIRENMKRLSITAITKTTYGGKILFTIYGPGRSLNGLIKGVMFTQSPVETIDRETSSVPRGTYRRIRENWFIYRHP